MTTLVIGSLGTAVPAQTLVQSLKAARFEIHDRIVAGGASARLGAFAEAM